MNEDAWDAEGHIWNLLEDLNYRVDGEQISRRKLLLFARACWAMSRRTNLCPPQPLLDACTPLPLAISSHDIEHVLRHCHTNLWFTPTHPNVPNFENQLLACRLLREVLGCPARSLQIPESHYHAIQVTSGSDLQIVRKQLRWLTPQVKQLAQAAYDNKLGNTLEVVRMHVLADALEEAGCPDNELLRHLRGRVRCPCRVRCSCGGTGWVPSPVHHVQGCWAIDLVLGIW